ncbi:MAG: hypothetical protein KDA71_15300, partial [Planctomycetales bacterium]|nr:hypothetical protein [Planctomycetales bacterium]
RRMIEQTRRMVELTRRMVELTTFRLTRSRRRGWLELVLAYGCGLNKNWRAHGYWASKAAPG